MNVITEANVKMEKMEKRNKEKKTSCKSPPFREPLPLFAPSAELLFQARRPRIKSGQIQPTKDAVPLFSLVAKISTCQFRSRKWQNAPTAKTANPRKFGLPVACQYQLPAYVKTAAAVFWQTKRQRHPGTIESRCSFDNASQ